MGNMKFLVAFSAIVAMAYAEADPYYGYGYAGAYGLGYYGLGYGYAHGLKSAPCVNAANVPVPCAAGGYLHYAKRDAEADPYYGYGYAGAYGLGYHGLGYGYAHGLKSAPCVNAANAVVAAAPAVVAAAPAVVAAAPAPVVHNAVLGTADLPNPVHAVAHTYLGTVHSSHVGVCTNYLGEQVSC